MYVRCEVRAFTLIVLVVVTTFEKIGSVHIGHASSLVYAYKCTCIIQMYLGLSQWYRIISCNSRLDDDILKSLHLVLKISLQCTVNTCTYA